MDVRGKLVELIRRFCSGLSVSDITQPYGYENLADFMISNGVTVQEWISVEDRLPEKDGSYLVITNFFCKYQGIDIRCFAKDGETVDEYELAGQKYVWYFYDGEYGYVSTDSVTHWMPLPEQPK